MKRTFPITLALLAWACPLVTGRLVAAERDWSFDVSPYLWVANVGVETSLPSTPSGVDRFETKISAGAMFAAQVRYRSFGLFVDFAWLRLDTEAINPGPAFSTGDLQSDFIHTTAALTYSLPLRGKFHTDVLAGARLWYVSEDLEYSSGALPGFSRSGDKTWVDPVIGADMRYDLSRRWSLEAKGTVGGFGVASDIAWEAFCGASYRFNDCCSLTFGYRYLHEEYSRGGFALNLDTHGFLLGVGFHF